MVIHTQDGRQDKCAPMIGVTLKYMFGQFVEKSTLEFYFGDEWMKYLSIIRDHINSKVRMKESGVVDGPLKGGVVT